MKRLILILVAGLLLLSMSSGFAENDPFMQDMVIAHLPKTVGGAWFTRMYQGFGQYSGMSGSETFQIGPSTGDAAAHNANVQDLVAQGVDAICVVPFAPEQIDAELGKARDAGTIIVSNEGTALKNIDYDLEAFDNTKFGQGAAELLGEGMGGKGSIIVFVGSLGSTAHMSWANSIVDTIQAKYPEITVANKDGVFIETGNNAANSYEKAKEALKAYPEATGIFCPSATDTPSIARAIQEAGLTNQITYVAVGLPNAVRTYVKSGDLDVVVCWDPADVGLAMCKLAAAAKSGYEVQTGDDLGVFGFNSVIVDGKVVMGSEWRVLTAAEIDDFNF